MTICLPGSSAVFGVPCKVSAELMMDGINAAGAAVDVKPKLSGLSSPSLLPAFSWLAWANRLACHLAPCTSQVMLQNSSPALNFRLMLDAPSDTSKYLIL